MATSLRDRALGFLSNEELDRLLHNSDVEASDDEDDPTYTPPDLAELSPPQADIEQLVDDAQPADVDVQRLRWFSKEMPQKDPIIDELGCQGESSDNVLYSFFKYYNEGFWQLVADQTNLYSVQTRDHRSVQTSANEIINFTGIQVLMGTLKYPQARLYWRDGLSVPLIKDAMPRDRFFELRNNLHFADNSLPNPLDKLWKIRPILTSLIEKCHTLPRSKHLSIDEQMIPFSGRCEYRQYVPSKPNPLGLKNFVLAGTDGLVLDFHIYTGSGTVSTQDMKDLGLGAGIVKLLCRTIPNQAIIYTDRFFTSLKLANYLNTKEEIYLVGTVMVNRIGDVAKKFKADKDLVRGSWDEWVRQDDKVCVLKWKDTKSVIMLSTVMGSTPAGQCRRWDKNERRKIDVEQPAAVKAYNSAMGGIDLCDRLIAYYRSSMRTRKWTIRCFSHFIDLTIVNCWLMYVRCCKAEKVAQKDQLGLMEYRIRIATAMIKFEGGAINRSFVGSSSTITRSATDSEMVIEDEPPKKRARAVIPQPVLEVRYDNVGHLPKSMDDKFASKCRMEGCTSRSRVICVKCGIYLCIMKNNCFIKYHELA